MLADVPLATNALVLIALLAVSSGVSAGGTRDTTAGGAATGETGTGDTAKDVTGSERLSVGDLGLPHESWGSAVAAGALGTRATFVQVSSEGCATCPQVSRMLGGLAEDGVGHVEVDAAERLALVRRLGILRTPTVLLVDGEGRLVSRTSGAVRAEQARAALAQIPSQGDAGVLDLVTSGGVR